MHIFHGMMKKEVLKHDDVIGSNSMVFIYLCGWYVIQMECDLPLRQSTIDPRLDLNG